MAGTGGGPEGGAMRAGAAVVDAPSAVEFMREALIRIDEGEIGAVAGLLEGKRAILAPFLTETALRRGNAEAVRPILDRCFATRRRADAILVRAGAPALAAAIGELLHGEGPVEARFGAFDERFAALEAPLRREFAGECLHFSDPERHWLWARWMWDPETRTGALPLVLVDSVALEGPGAGAIYGRIGVATRAVMATADELGFTRMRSSPFAVDVYLAAIYGVYLYTVTRLRMTQEFTRVIPRLPDLVRRLLGVYRLEGVAA